MAHSSDLALCSAALGALVLAACSEAGPSVVRPDPSLILCDDGLAEACFEQVSDTTGLMYARTEGGYAFRLLAMQDGAELQSFTETHGNAISGPSLEDLDQDGDPELIVPDFTGTVNTVYRIWQLIDGRFALAGEVSGFDLEHDPETGLIGLSSRSSAIQYVYQAYLLTEEGLVLAYAMDSNFGDRTCVLTPGPVFDLMGLDANALLTACEAEL